MQRGDLVNVILPYQGGHEQAGQRPAIAIVSQAMLAATSLLLVVPVTKNLETLRFPHTFQISPSPRNGLSVPSVALVYQLRALDSAKVVSVRGHLEDHSIERLDSELRQMLGL